MWNRRRRLRERRRSFRSRVARSAMRGRLNRMIASADGCVAVGPLYHLTERADRLEALREAHRVLRSGGRVFAAAISRFASLMDGLSRDLVADPRFVEIVRQDLKDGQHRNPTDNPQYFTTTFFHHPEELRQEIEDAGFTFEKTVAVEGPVWVMGNFSKHWDDPAKRALLLEFLRTVEEEKSAAGSVGAYDWGWEEVTRRTGRSGKSDGKSPTSVSAEGPGTVEHSCGRSQDDGLLIFRVRGSTRRIARYFNSRRAFSKREISSAVL